MIFFHVGFPKAASTMLQKCLFAEHPEIINLGLYPTSNIGKDNIQCREKVNAKIPFYLNDSRISNLYNMLGQPNSLEFDSMRTKILWHELLDDYGDSVGLQNIGSKIVMSHESITSCRFAHPETLEKARRIKEVFGSIKIIMICRRQQEMLKSLYRDHPFDPHSIGSRLLRPVSFKEWLAIDLDRGSLSLSRSLYFGRAARVFEDFFGKENVLVLPMELLKVNLRFFSCQISHFLGVRDDLTYSLLSHPPVNTGVSASKNKYRAMKAKLMPFFQYFRPLKKHLLFFDRYILDLLGSTGSPAVIELDSHHEQLLKELFAYDNSSLADSRRLPLGDLGYYL